MKIPTYIAILLFALTLSARAYAQTSNPSPTDEEATSNIKRRLVNNQVQADESDILSTSPKAFVGTVQDIVQNNIAIATKDGQKFATPTEETIIIRTPGNTEIDADSIQIDDYIIAMGYLVSGTKLESTRIIVSATLSTGLNKTTGRATVAEISANSISLTSDTNDATAITFNSSTVFKDKNGVIDETDIEPGSTIIYTARIDASDNLTATIVMMTSLTNTEEPIE